MRPWTLAGLLLCLGTLPVAAQTGPAAAGSSPGLLSGLRGFVEAGPAILQATESLDAIFGTRRATRVGGGIALSLPAGLFADVRVTRMHMTGTRGFVVNGQRYSVGIEDRLTIVPVQVSGGLRFSDRTGRLVTWVGGGLGWYQASESSDFADADENVSRTSPGYHVLGGADVRLWRFLGAGGEVEWSHVPGGLSGTGLASALGDTNLGGLGVRARLVLGRW